ncbi:MAG: pyridoxamine 5'-phosphate oxidase family protein [Actinomycetales bacterium]
MTQQPLLDPSASPATAEGTTTPAPSGSARQIRRHRERSHPERAALDAVLDSIPFGTLSTVVDARPWVVPMLFARQGDSIILHGSTGAGALRHVAAGAPASLCVIGLDGVVVAASTFHSSANYRSAVVHGPLTPITDPDEKWSALNALSDRLIPGRTTEVRDMEPRELAATLAMKMPIVTGEWTVKIRSGGVGDDARDEPAWQGVVPVRTVLDEPEPADWVDPAMPVPASVRTLLAEGWHR